MLFRNIIKLFEDGNVCVTGLRGRGKDMLMSNVVVRRNIDYISNVCYLPDKHIDYIPSKFDVGKNSYKDFITGKIKQYVYPYQDGTDLYISDVGVYFPSQYCNELNREYPYMPTFFALSRQLGKCNVHINVQNLNRAWDKIREQSDMYISCQRCIVLFGKIVIQKVILYDLYDSCLRRVKPYKVNLPLFASREMKLQADIDKQRYEQSNGMVRGAWLIYTNKSNYDTRVFKSMLENGIQVDNTK